MEKKKIRPSALIAALALVVAGNGCLAGWAAAEEDGVKTTPMETALPNCHKFITDHDKAVIEPGIAIADEETYLDFDFTMQGISEDNANYANFQKLGNYLYRAEHTTMSIANYLHDSFLADEACLADLDALATKPQFSTPVYIPPDEDNGDQEDASSDQGQAQGADEDPDQGMALPVSTVAPVLANPAAEEADAPAPAEETSDDSEVVWEAVIYPQFLALESVIAPLSAAIYDHDPALFSAENWEALFTDNSYLLQLEFYAYTYDDKDNLQVRGGYVLDIVNMEVKYTDDAAKPADRVLKDSSTSVEVNIGSITAPDDVTLKTTDRSKSEAITAVIDEKNGEKLIGAYDLSLYSESEKKYYSTFDKEVSVFIPIPDTAAVLKNLYARYVNKDGKVTESDIAVEVVGSVGGYYAKFLVKHFSDYAIVSTDKPVVIKTPAPSTDQPAADDVPAKTPGGVLAPNAGFKMVPLSAVQKKAAITILAIALNATFLGFAALYLGRRSARNRVLRRRF